MANVLKAEKQEMAIAALAEGSSIRSIERMTGVHRDTIMRLGLRVGNACGVLMDKMMRELTCKTLEIDEIWGFVGKKQRNASADDRDNGLGDVWTFVALDAKTKLVPAYRVGKRDGETANAFLRDLASRLVNRVQISTDGLAAYVEAVEQGFGGEVDYAQVVKTFVSESKTAPEARYSPGQIATVVRTNISGTPDESKVSTSYVERQNLTMRMHCRRLTRLTNAFSKKLENFKAAVGLHFAYYNLVKKHATLKMTPAMAAGVTRDFWTVKDLLARA